MREASGRVWQGPGSHKTGRPRAASWFCWQYTVCKQNVNRKPRATSMPLRRAKLTTLFKLPMSNPAMLILGKLADVSV